MTAHSVVGHEGWHFDLLLIIVTDASGCLVTLPVHVDVTLEEMGGGERHDAAVVHPLAVLALAVGQIAQSALLAVEHNVDSFLLHLLRQRLQVVAHLQPHPLAVTVRNIHIAGGQCSVIFGTTLLQQKCLVS